MKKENPSPVLAICVADIHLSHNPPVARSAEKDWYAAMRRQLRQLRDLALECSSGTNPPVPILFAGDIFDNGWKGSKCPPSLINFAVKHLPKGYGVPGQHDLENHRYEEMKHSAYGVLVQAGVITNIPPGEPIMVSSPYSPAPFRLHGFPWGCPVESLKDSCDPLVEIAVVHDYVWMKDYGYADAPEEKRVKNLMPKAKGYDVIICGDNHVSFSAHQLFNCGSFFRRTSTEKQHRPSAGLIHADGTVTRHFFNVSEDKWLDDEQLAKAIIRDGDVDGLVAELSKLSDVAISFEEALQRALEKGKTPKQVKELVLQFLENG
jgi:hypothetical protein